MQMFSVLKMQVLVQMQVQNTSANASANVYNTDANAKVARFECKHLNANANATFLDAFAF